MIPISFSSCCEADTDRLGAALGELLPAGTTVALCGTLGAGKTRLVQAIAVGLGVPRDLVTSPTFVLYQRYEGQRTLHHLDAYRLTDADEFLQLGVEELFESNGVTLVEWADRVRDLLPAERLEIRIDVSGELTRRFEIEAVGDAYREVVNQLSLLLKVRQ